MRIWENLIIGLSLILSATVFGQFFYKSRQNNTIKVVGSATKTYESDIVKWRITLERQAGAGDSRTAYLLIKNDFQTVWETLLAAGIRETEITVQPVNKHPIYNNMGEFTGYKLQQTIMVISESIAKVEKLALNPDPLSARGVILESSQLEYYISRLPEIKQELLAMATQDARKRAVEIARNSGGKIGKLASARAGVFQITEPYSTEVSDYGIYSTATKKKDITITVSALFYLQ